jgi:hypothetical protein
MKNYLAFIVSSPRLLGLAALVCTITLFTFSVLVHRVHSANQFYAGNYSNRLLLAGPANSQSKIVAETDKANDPIIDCATKAAKQSLKSKVSQFFNELLSGFHQGLIDGYQGK